MTTPYVNTVDALEDPRRVLRALDQATELQADQERADGRRALAELLRTLRSNAEPLDCQACRRMILAVNWAITELEEV